MSEFIHKLFTSYKARTDGDTRIGELNRIWYDSITNTLRIQLDDTPGGTVIGGGGEGGGDYTLPTASTTVKGGVKIDGTTITINNQVISGFSGSYTDLTNKPTIPAAQVNSDWNASSGLAQILNKPALFSGSYTDLTNKPTLFDGAYASLTGKPTLFSGSYNDLTDKPTIPSAYTLPTATDTILGGVKIGSNITINEGVISVAAPFSGSYTDLTNKPTIPAAQIQSDWTQSNNASLDFIKNKPTIPDIGPIQEVFSATTEPMGHADKSQSTISFDDSSRTFTISPVSASYNVWVKGVKFVISTTRTVTIPNTSGLYYIYFDAAGALQYQTSFFDWPNQAPTAYVYWNSGTGKAPMVADERHGIVLDWQTHEYLHRTRGAAIANGFGASNYILGGNGSLNTHIQLDIASGTFFDEDLEVEVVSTNTPTANTWEQDLTGPSQIPIFYLSGTTGWVRDNPTTFPLKRGSVRPVYNLNTAGTWSTPDIDNNKFGATFIIATNNINYPVMGVISQTQHANQNDAEALEWNDLNLTGFPIVEFRPLYKVVYQTKTSYSNTPKATIVSLWDLRSFDSVISSAASFVDANALSGTVLAPSVVTSSLTSVGTLTNLSVTNTITGSVSGNAGTVTNGVYTTDTGTVTNAMLAGNIANAKLLNSTVTIGSTVVALGTTTANLAGLNSVTATNFIGNATTVTNGVYTNSIGAVTDIMLAGSIANNKLTNSSITVNGTSISLGASGTITAAAGTLTGTTLNSSVVSSSLTSVGTLTNLTVTNTITGSVSGNAGTVTNGVYTNGTYDNPSWITSLAYSKLSGTPTLFSGSYTDLTNKPTIPAAYTFNVAADDSTLRTISSEETVKFVGAGGITTASDAEGAITITQGSTDIVIKVAGSFASDQPFKSQVLTDLTDGVSISTWMGLPAFATNKTWKFDYDGDLTFPDNTVQSTAWTGTAAAGTLTGDTLNSTVVTSSLTSVGTLTGLTVGGTGGDLTMTGGAITGVGNITASGILAVNASGGITTTQTSFDIVNSTATTVNIGGAATAVNIGAITGTLTLNNPTVVGTQTTATLFNTAATTVSAFGAATTSTIGATSGTMTLRNPTVVGTQTTVNLWNTTSTTVNAFGAATTLAIGAATGTLTLNNPTIATSTTGTLTLFNTGATTVTAFGAATTINLGYTNSIAFSNTFNIATNAQAFSTKTVNIGTGSSADGSTYVNIGSTLGQSYVTVNGTLTATLTGNASTATKLATARAINGVNFDGSAAITVTADAGTLSGSTLASGVTASSLTSVGTLTGVTSNAATAFIAGAAAESGVALQMPHEGALRNLTNGLTNMYFDVSIGGSTNGQFQFRSSNSFTNVLTMSPTAFNVNTNAVVTSRTPSFGRLAWNSAIDTELTIDDYRFRVSNQGGNFPQVISNTGGTKNSAWTVVASRSGSAVTQTGSTGALLPNNSWTSLYTSGGMDSAGDTYVATLQDKNEGRIYRVTFMRSDNGSTTGYNIIAERLL